MNIYGYNGKCNVCGNRVRDARQKAGISQSQLAARLQVEGVDLNQKAISRIETGLRFIADYEVVFLAKVLNVDSHWLLFGEEEKA